MYDEAIIKQAYTTAYGKCTEAIRNDLDLDTVLARITEEGDVIGLIKMNKQICYNFQSHKYSPLAIHDAVLKLYVQDCRSMCNTFGPTIS